MFKKKIWAAMLFSSLTASITFNSMAAVIYSPGITGVTEDGEALVTDGAISSSSDSSDSSGGYRSIGGGSDSSAAASRLLGVTTEETEISIPSVDDVTTGSASKVSEDPILEMTPMIHAQVLMADGNLTDGFTTYMGAYDAPGDGFTGLKLRLENSVGDIYYRVYTEEHGWTDWAMNEMITTYLGDGAKVTAVQIRGNGHTKNQYDFYYRAVLDDGSVLGWAKNGESAGTIGTGRYIEKLQIALWPAGEAIDRPTEYRFIAENEEGVLTDDNGVHYYSTWNGEPYTGWGYDTDNNKYYFKDSAIVTGWQYIDGYKYYFDEEGKVVTDLEPIIGLQDDYLIRINKSMKTMTIYAKDGDNGYIMPVKVILNTIGPDTPIGTFTTYEKYRWKFMHDDIYCQYLLRFKDGYILHSIIYQPEPDIYCLDASTYNYLGKNQSDGCVRMTSGDAYWVYTNCGVGTTVEIYEDEISPGPFDRPAIQQAIPFDQNYDPTDPVIVQQLADEDEQAAAEAQQEAATGIEAPPTEVDDD